MTRYFLLTSFFFFLSAHAEELPQWSPEDLLKLEKGEIIIDGELVSSETLEEPPEDTIKMVPALPEIENDWSMDANDLSILPDLLIQQYFNPSELNRSGITDPQRLLTEQEIQDVSYLLDIHQSDSLLPIYLYLLDENQQLPTNIQLRDFYKKNHDTKARGVIILYQLGNCQQSKIYIHTQQYDKIEQWQVNEVLAKSAMIAREKSDEFSQLEDYLSQISMRLFWVEKGLHIDSPTNPLETPNKSKKQKSNGLLSRASHWWSQHAGEHISLLTAGSISLLVLAISLYIYRKRMKIHLPAPGNTPSLGSPSGGSLGAPMKYIDPSSPPSDQKKRLSKKTDSLF